MHVAPPKSRPKSYLPLLLAFILTNEVCDNFILSIFSDFGRHSISLEFIFYLLFLLIQIICSPIQAGYSDFYCRKRSLLFSLACSALALLPLLFFKESARYYFIVLILVSLGKGALGNTLALSWAGIADTQTREVRWSFGLSTSAMAIGYLILIALTQFCTTPTIVGIVVSAYCLLFFLCRRQFLDIRADKKEVSLSPQPPSSIRSEIQDLFHHFLQSKQFRNCLLTFLLWEVSFYTIHMLDVDFKILAFKGITFCMVCGYLLGVTILKFLRFSHGILIMLGYLVSIIAILLLFIFYFTYLHIKELMMPCYFFVALGSAFLVPSLFAYVSEERGVHEQGKIYGLFDSADALAICISAISLLVYNLFKIKPMYLITYAFGVFLLSWVPYAKTNIRGDAAK